MADYLFRRGARYSFRRRYPNDVAAALGKVEFVQALGTADRREAEKLARLVSVKFDNICEEALLRLAKSTAQAIDLADAPEGGQTNENLTKSVLDRLPGIIRMATESVIAEQARNRAGWTDVVSWQKKALKAHIAGQMPTSIAMVPVEARVALDAIEAAARGEPMEFVPSATTGKEKATVPPTPTAHDDASILNQSRLDAALSEYSSGKSHRRKMMAQRQAAAMLQIPCTRTEATAAITAWCKAELSRGKKPSSVWTEASAVNALLKYVPGWHQFSVPKVGELRQLKGAGKASRSARPSMPVSTLHQVLRTLPQHLPRNGEYWHAALLLCALYGFRPGELLGASIEALREVEDIWSTSQLVFRVGINGAKNESSKRDVPVPEDLRPLFELALSREQDNAETVRSRVEKLNALVGKAQRNAPTRHTMYSVRHLFADVARDCGYADADFGPLMGHKAGPVRNSVCGARIRS
ncbi:DUF6538 domain-containing protein [Massilia timonae]|uniref:DUF6538 domain-containing protein n=1 Tax=Massilia timonae TaxID=47229 RepID=UPI0028ADD0D5|nr:DUF6538 domain-containing protein [Massilia timonae]